MKINTTLLKYIIVLAFVILLSTIATRVLLGKETLSDYAESNPEIAYKEPIKEEIPPQDDITSEEENLAPDAANTESEIEYETANASNNITISDVESPTEPEVIMQENDSISQDNSSANTEETEILTFNIEPLSQEIIDRITGISYQENPNITLDELRYLTIPYIDFSGEAKLGELICNEAIAQDLIDIFTELYENEYQIEKMVLVDEYGGDDTLSMEDNNTSCFNYRVVDGTTRLSKHALGLAIDINPFYNPYIVYNKNGTGETYISPKGSEIYADRSQSFPYKIDTDDLCYRLFKEHGFTWGGDWNSTKDYQHFQKPLN